MWLLMAWQPMTKSSAIYPQRAQYVTGWGGRNRVSIINDPLWKMDERKENQHPVAEVSRSSIAGWFCLMVFCEVSLIFELENSCLFIS